VVRRPYLLALPVLLDLALAFAPALTFPELGRRVGQALTDFLLSASLSPDTLVAAGTQLGSLTAALQSWNVLGLLAWQLPTLSAPVFGSPPAPAGATLTSVALGLFAAGGFMVVGLLLAAAYLRRIALAAVRDESRARGASYPAPSLSQEALATGHGWLHLTLLRVMQAIAVVFFLVVGGGMAAGLGGVGFLFAGAVFGAAILAYVLTFLAEEAVFAGRATAWRAVGESYRIARANGGALVRLWLVVSVVTYGFDLLWAPLTGSAIGDVAAILGNAFLATGLAASVMVFYLDRRAQQAAVAQQA
jgi:hypothetical protein